jgi:carbamate kinase
MGPKVEAALRFVEQGGARAVITSLEHIADAVERDDVGTVLLP